MGVVVRGRVVDAAGLASRASGRVTARDQQADGPPLSGGRRPVLWVCSRGLASEHSFGLRSDFSAG